MPRSPAGVYSLPNTGFPIPAPATTIIAPEENAVRNDLAQALTDSLDRNGTGGMLAPFRIADGLLATPGLAFLNEPGTGLYREAGSKMSLAVQGTKVMEFTPTSVVIVAPAVFTIVANGTVTGNLTVGGTLILPSGDINTNAPVSLKLGTNGATSLEILHVGGAVNWIRMQPSTAGSAVVIIPVGASADIPLAIGGKGNASVDIYANGAGPLVVRVLPSAGPNYLTITGGINPTVSTSAGNLFLGRFTNIAAGLSVNSLSAIYFDGGFDTQINESAPNILTVVCGGNPAVSFASGAINQFFQGLSIPAGAGLYLDGGSNTFIIENVPDAISFFCNATQIMRVDTGSILAKKSIEVELGNTFNLLGSAGTNFGRFAYSPGGNTTLTIDNGFDGADAEIRLRTRTTNVAKNCLILTANGNTMATILSIVTGTDQNDVVPHFKISGQSSSGLHWVDATAYYIGQNSGVKQLRCYSGGNSDVGVALVAGATAWANYSDERMKDIIEPITDAAKKVSEMRHVIGTLKADDKKRRRAMMIAQDAAKVLPEAVSLDADEFLLLEYSSIIPLHGAAISEHEARIRALELKA